jgi:hypothetical protein
MSFRSALALSPITLLAAPAFLAGQGSAPLRTGTEKLTYSVEWRFVRAGEATVEWTADRQAEFALRSVGLVSNLFTINDHYRATYDPGFCALTLEMNAQEGRRRRLTQATFDRQKGRASYLDKDLVKDTVLTAKEMDVPSCVQDPLAGLDKLRTMKLAVGQSAELPVSDGKKVVMARVEAQEKEVIRTPVGQFTCTKYEAFLFNGVLYGRKGRLTIWISDDARRLPLQVKVQLPFYIGNVTVTLDKVETK